MSVTIRPYRRGGWEVDIRVVAPDGTREFRERKRAPVSSRSAASRWAESRERVLFERLMKPPQDNAPPKEVPTLREFAARFLDGHARANRQKPSGVAAKEMILRVHLMPALGHKRLDGIKSEDVQHLKGRLSTKAAKTVNNILTVLNVLLKKAVDWDVIDRMPCAVTLLPVPKTSMSFYDFDEYERLVLAASALDATAHLIVLLGGESGLRCGEMIALEWRDVDLAKRQICVQRSDWNGQVTTPKGGRLRYVPLTIRLAAAFRDHRHLRSPNVLCQDDGQPLTRQMVQYRVLRASRRANLNAACRARMRLRLAEGIQGRTGRRTLFNVARVRSKHFPEIPDQIVRRNVDAIRALAMHKHNARLGATRAVANSGNDSGSHGVSDPSGQARGHIGRAQRGRSRHGFPSHSGSGTCSGRQRAPPNH